jgi:carbon starvation protein
MFGIANQMLAVIGLTVVTTAMFNAGRGRYAWITILPMTFVTVTTTTAAYQLVTDTFYNMRQKGLATNDSAMAVKGALNMIFVTLIVVAVGVILVEAIFRWFRPTQPVTSATATH